MTIKQQGGIFGRNPTFNDVTVEGTLTTSGAQSFSELDVDNININGNTISSTDTNGNVNLDPDGTGVVNVSSAKLGVNATPDEYLTVGGAIRAQSNALNWASSAGVLMDYYAAGSVGRFVASDTVTTGSMSLGTNGNLTIYGNLVVGTSGKGIDFSATSGTGTSELFSDYEEGSWTPTPTQSAFVNPTGSYVKMGKLVVATFELTGFTTGFGNFFQISGLPYAPVASGQNSGSLGYIDNGVTDLIFRVNSATSGIDVYNSSNSIYRYNIISDDKIAGAVTYITT